MKHKEPEKITIKFSGIKDAIVMLDGDKVKGQVNMKQNGWKVDLNGKIEGLPQNSKHAIILHEFGDMRGKCEALGDHYNPYNKNHGDREGGERHYGDLGNIEANEKGIAEFNFSVSGHIISWHNFLGRSLAIHENKDDLGKGKTKESKQTGNIGKALSCGVVGAKNTEYKP